VLTQLCAALLRAVLVMVLVATPSALLPLPGEDGRAMVALVALFGGVLTFVEYNSRYPGLIEFRDAPPYNRIRFAMLFCVVFFLSVAFRAEMQPSTLGALVAALAHVCGLALDFPYSPVRLATLIFADAGADPRLVRSAAGAAYMTALLALGLFVLILRLQDWPSRNGAFNVWVNLPTFDPSAGGDVVLRLERDARINLALGFVLPFLIPAAVTLGAVSLGALNLSAQQTLIWTVAAWAFLPASLFMRGIAMSRIAGMIRARRARSARDQGGALQPA
jgi:hypothetical protein